jgi:hypothetical protein
VSVGLLVSCGGSGAPRSSEAVIPPVHAVVDASVNGADAEPVETEDANPEAGTDDASPEGGEDAGPPVGLLDCTFLDGPNCWKTAAASADSCLPEVGMLATLSTDGTMCVYTSGSVVTFPSSVIPVGMSNFTAFTLTTGGTACLAYAQQGTQGSTLMTPAGTVTLSVEADGGSLGLTCPDGTMYAGPVAALSSCQASVPGYDSASGGLATADGGTAELTVSLTGTGLGSTGELYVFGCSNQ